MQIVIDIPEEEYELCQRFGDTECLDVLMIAVKYGTPLPKGHGRLKDENEIKRMIEETKVNSEHSKTFAENIIRFASTIIEAESEVER